MAIRPRFSDEQLIELFHEAGKVGELARREKVSPRSLTAYWRNLQREERLPFVRVADESALRSAHGPPLGSENDGRPSVDAQWQDDPLLSKLFAKHRAPPGDPNYQSGL